jgi:hypothetical protein
MSGSVERDPPESLGVVVLGLVSCWDAWVNRRVDSFAFAGDDERVLARHHSIDFEVTKDLSSAAQDCKWMLGIPVPITILDKWRISEFSLRDDRDRALSLLTRAESTRIMTSALCELAARERSGHVRQTNGGPLVTSLPDTIRDVITDIVCGERSDAVRVCATFVATVRGRPNPIPDAQTVEDWATTLASSPEFMGLAFELARGFVLFARYPATARGNQLLKMSYNSYVVPPSKDPVLAGVAFRHFMRSLHNGSRDSSETRPWKVVRDGQSGQLGGSFFVTALHDVSKRPEDIGTIPEKERSPALACAFVTVSNGRRRRTLRVRPNGAIGITGLPDGHYEASISPASGFEIKKCTRASFSIKNGMAESGSTERMTIEVERARVTRRVVPATAKMATKAAFLRRFLRGLAWSSKPLIIRIRFWEGGSYHCEFRAPDGMHVTRAKLVSDQDARSVGRNGTVSLKLESVQTAHLYAPRVPESGIGEARALRPTAGYVLVNLRPRVETIARPGYMTAILTLGVVVLLAHMWNPHTGFASTLQNPAAVLALLLGAPGVLTAAYRQVVHSRVTNAMLYGLRLASLAPALIPIACGAFLLAEPGHPWAAGPFGVVWPMTLIVAAAAVALIVLGGVAYAAEHPPEQRKSDAGQGPGFESRLLDSAVGVDDDAEGGAATYGITMTDKVQRDTDSAASVREVMMDLANGLSTEARRNLLGKLVLWSPKRRQDIPPALFFDSSQTPPTFVDVSITSVSTRPVSASKSAGVDDEP